MQHLVLIAFEVYSISAMLLIIETFNIFVRLLLLYVLLGNYHL